MIRSGACYTLCLCDLTHSRKSLKSSFKSASQKALCKANDSVCILEGVSQLKEVWLIKRGVVRCCVIEYQCYLKIWLPVTDI